MELFDLKANLNTVGTQLASVEKEIMNKAADPNASIEDVRALKQKKDDLKERMDILQNQHDSLEREQKAKIQASLQQAKAGVSEGLTSSDPKTQKTSAKA
ncbi:TPA: hypothetical protein ACF3MF_002922, partial [Enterococcus faecium]